MVPTDCSNRLARLESCFYLAVPCRSGEPGSCLLTPPDAVGDPEAELTPAQLANQALLAARKAIVRWAALLFILWP
jgi:hypothetical protein